MAQVLNPLLQVVSYNGGSQDNRIIYNVSSCLDIKSKTPHCSGPGTNFDLLLKVQDETEILVTNFIARVPFQMPCSSPLRDGAVWFSTSLPDLASYSSQYNDADPHSPPTTDPRPDILFTIPPSEGEYQFAFPQPKPARFIHVKFIAPDTDDDDKNVDVGYIGFVGYKQSEAPTNYVAAPIPEELGVTKVQPKTFNELNQETSDFLTCQPSLILLSGNLSAEEFDQLKAKFRPVSESPKFKNMLYFFYAFEKDCEELAAPIRSFCGFQDSAPRLVLADWNDHQKFEFPNVNNLNEESVLQFLQDWINDKLTPLVKSGPRSLNDRFPDHPDLYQITALSFEELVLNSNKDVLVDVWADWCGPCIAIGPTLTRLASLLRNVPSIAIGKLNCDENDVDKQYFPENGIPNIKLFVSGKKQHPIKYNGNRSLVDFLKFLHANVSTPFDLQPLQAKAERIAALSKDISQAEQHLSDIKEKFNLAKDQLDNADVVIVKQHLADLSAALDSVGDETSPPEILKEKAVAFVKTNTYTNLKHLSKQIKDQREQKALKKVKKIHSKEEFDSAIAAAKEAGKLLIVDFTAVWCGPCQYIGPIFASYSEDYPDVVFLKVDVDELPAVSEAAGVECMPTFILYKNGEKLDLLEGADPDSLQELIVGNL